jgi:hypothetical protein
MASRKWPAGVGRQCLIPACGGHVEAVALMKKAGVQPFAAGGGLPGLVRVIRTLHGDRVSHGLGDTLVDPRSRMRNSSRVRNRRRLVQFTRPAVGRLRSSNIRPVGLPTSRRQCPPGRSTVSNDHPNTQPSSPKAVPVSLFDPSIQSFLSPRAHRSRLVSFKRVRSRGLSCSPCCCRS